MSCVRQGERLEESNIQFSIPFSSLHILYQSHVILRFSEKERYFMKGNRSMDDSENTKLFAAVAAKGWQNDVPISSFPFHSLIIYCTKGCILNQNQCTISTLSLLLPLSENQRLCLHLVKVMSACEKRRDGARRGGMGKEGEQECEE